MPLTSTKKKRRTHGVIGLTFMVIWLIFIATSNNIFISLEDHLQEIFNILTPYKPKAPAVAIVDIDDLSLQKVGQWPWPRYVLGNLIKATRQEKSQVIGMDILLLEPDRTSLNYIQQRYKMEFDMDMFVVGVPEGMRDNDHYLASVLRDEAPIVGATQLILSRARDTHTLKHIFNTSLNLPYAEMILKNTPEIRTSLTRAGFVNFINEGDGVLRNIPMIINSDEGNIPSFTLAMLMEKEGVDHFSIEKTVWGREINVGQYHIPVDNEGKAWINTKPAESPFVSISSSMILSGQSDKISEPLILIGSSSAALHDKVIMRDHQAIAGVGAHATMLNNIMNNNVVIHPSWLKIWDVITCISLLSVINILYLLSSNFTRRISIITFLVILLNATMFCAFYFYNVWLPVIYTVIGAFILIILHELVEYLILRKNMNIWKEDLENSNHALLHAMAAVCDSRDPETGGHTSRTQFYVKRLAEVLEKYHPEAQHPFFIDSLFHAAPLHDVGKVAIPDSILLKPGALTDEEFDVIKTHTTIGRRLLADAADKLRAPSEFLHCAIDMAGCHHERWDGKGYPDRLSGTDIPFCARVMAVADVYDALTSKRVYKKSMSHSKALDIIISGAGTQFDPSVVNAFLECEQDIKEICSQFTTAQGHSR